MEIIYDDVVMNWKSFDLATTYFFHFFQQINLYDIIIVAGRKKNEDLIIYIVYIILRKSITLTSLRKYVFNYSLWIITMTSLIIDLILTKRD